ncbi:MAG: hypothetical protein ACE5KM_05440 [Planctomycetaceae bacterium]
MRIVLIVTIVVGAVFHAAVKGDDVADSGKPNQQTGPYDGTAKPGDRPPVVERSPFVPCIGRGYRSYMYPTFGSCPCGSSSCYHPGRYYCGGKSYKRQWYRTWVRAHLGKGSMLDPYRCECRFPTVGRTYIVTTPAPTPPKVMPPVPPLKK